MSAAPNDPTSPQDSSPPTKARRPAAKSAGSVADTARVKAELQANAARAAAAKRSAARAAAARAAAARAAAEKAAAAKEEAASERAKQSAAKVAEVKAVASRTPAQGTATKRTAAKKATPKKKTARQGAPSAGDGAAKSARKPAPRRDGSNLQPDGSESAIADIAAEATPAEAPDAVTDASARRTETTESETLDLAPVAAAESEPLPATETETEAEPEPETLAVSELEPEPEAPAASEHGEAIASHKDVLAAPSGGEPENIVEDLSPSAVPGEDDDAVESERPADARTSAEVATAAPAEETPAVPAAAEPDVASEPEPADLPAEQAADQPAGDQAIVVRGLIKRFGDSVAVDRIDLTVPAGSFYGIVGPNGAGKTTTLSIIAGLLRADAGTVRISGIDQAEHPLAAKKVLGVLPDRLRTFDRLTGRQLLHYYGLLRGLPADVVEKRVADLARAFDLTGALGRVVSDYSAGMTKKVMLAGAMIHSPRVLVLDEPFESVDPVSSAVILDILRAYVAHGGTVVLSSHGMDLVEQVCSRIAIIVGGEVLAEGTIDEVRAGRTLAQRFVELSGSGGEVEGLEWLHTFSG
ncbi:ATP-binding cassette domain-containing protein [Microbacterium sp. 22242]|uniref:ABC transporter ATP-binding protein n=1 Tax=Microbacterium sp. 22242 TaxID=3453896 RepID=UPI003F86CB09